MTRKLVYIAGPYSHGDVAVNVRRAIDAATEVLNAGHMPYVPHLCHFWHLINPQQYETWMALGRAYLPSCDVVVVLRGFSPGTEREVIAAQSLGIPVLELEDFLADSKGEV